MLLSWLNRCRIGEQDVTKPFLVMVFKLYNMEVSLMHNLVSYNQLAGWKGKMEEIEQDHESAVNDYFQCLIECDDTDSVCKRVCKEVLV